jgi:hypothetical protein
MSKIFHVFKEPEGSLTCSQKLIIQPYPKAVESSPYLYTRYIEGLTNQEANSCAASENSDMQILDVS